MSEKPWTSPSPHQSPHHLDLEKHACSDSRPHSPSILLLLLYPASTSPFSPMSWIPARSTSLSSRWILALLRCMLSKSPRLATLQRQDKKVIMNLIQRNANGSRFAMRMSRSKSNIRAIFDLAVLHCTKLDQVVCISTVKLTFPNTRAKDSHAQSLGMLQ